jgi:UDP-N-acetyl-D-galactosamine dehydrogenase
MGIYVASKVIKLMIARNIQPSDSRVLILGLAFKENCPDVRNTKIADVVEELQSFRCNVDVYDPWIDPEEAQHEYGITVVSEPEAGTYDAIIIGVAHDQFVALGNAGIRRFGRPNLVLYDIKHVLSKDQVDGRL